MNREEDGPILELGKIGDLLANGLSCEGIEATGGFVQEQKARISDQLNG